MTSYRYLGYGVTNSNGVAHLDHDPQGNPINGYTGTGAGEIDVLASLDNPIVEGSIVSETYSVWDTIQYDDLESTTFWNAPTGSGVLSVVDDYRMLSAESGNQSIASHTLTLRDKFIIEFEAKATATNMDFLQLIQSGSTKSSSQLGNVGASANTWYHFKLTIDSSQTNSYQLYCVETDTTHSQASNINTETGTLYFGFRINNSTNNIQFRNWKIYNL